VTSKTAMDQLRTQAALAASALKARQAERAALDEQISQGRVLAPATGRILTVPVSVGTVMMGGETVATMTTDQRVIRLQVPESNAKSLTVGDLVRVEGGASKDVRMPIALIYPHIVQGMVQVDLKIPEGDAQSAGYFVGQRVEAWVPQATRAALVIPPTYVATRYGLDFAKVRTKDGKDLNVPVVLGQPVGLGEGAEGVEVLSGLKPGDELVRP
jgi:multidrug efflux pump subunit AcrA (membrane-fusion protein)